MTTEVSSNSTSRPYVIHMALSFAIVKNHGRRQRQCGIYGIYEFAGGPHNRGCKLLVILYLVIQPSNGRPMEDWVNCEKMLYDTCPNTLMVIINGVLDKVLGGLNLVILELA